MRLTSAQYLARLADPAIMAQCDELERMLADRRAKAAALEVAPDASDGVLAEIAARLERQAAERGDDLGRVRRPICLDRTGARFHD